MIVKQSFRALLWTGLLLAVSANSFAQGWAVPAKTPETPVSCAACPGMDPSSMTVGYKAPIATFTGRFLDSSNTSEWFLPFRTARAYFVNVLPGIDRIYFRYGDGSVAAYSLSSFFTRLESGEPLVFPVNPVPQNRGGHPEVFLKWDEWFNPEVSSWKTFNIDGATRMTGFDVDDKGYVYVASTIYGWGIVKDGFSTGGSKMQSIVQEFPSQKGDATPTKIAAIKGATRYYALLASSTQPLWDVTDRKNPVQIHANVPMLSGFAKTTASDRIAILDSTYTLGIYTADGLAAGSSPLFRDASYTFVTSDGTNFFAVKNTPTGKAIAVIVPSGSGYTIQGTYQLGPDSINNLHYGDGYLVVTGSDAGNAWDLRLFKLSSSLVPSQIVINGTASNGSYSSYFHNYYGQAPSGYVTPGYVNIDDGTVYRSPSGKLYLIVCAKGIGDVYELAGGDTLVATNDGHTGTTNGNTPVASNTKTFYGDPVQFTAKTQSANIAGVSWNMGNAEAGTANLPTSAPNQPIVYQYSNLTKSGLGTKTVIASNVSDANVRGTASVTLESPVARFAIAGTGTKYLFTQPNASSAAPIIVGDSFVDASDGTVESHYTSWTIDGVNTKALPITPMSVGTCGSHSLTFTDFYGPYSAFTTRGSNFIVGLDANNGAFNYAVHPFAAALDLVGSDTTNTNLIFRSSSRINSALVTAAQGFGWTWEVINSNGGTLLTASGSGPTVADFLVPKQTLVGQQNARVRLTLKAVGQFTGGCAGMETTIAVSSPISAPDPTITLSGDCQGAPCSFSATSLSGVDTAADKWTYLWSVSPTGAIDATVFNTSTLTTSFLKTGTYTVSLTATNAVGATTTTKQVIINTASSPCGTLTNSSFVPTYTGALGCNPYQACASGESVTFQATAPLQGGYDPNCSPNHTYTWSFPDGQTGSGNPAIHTVTVGGTVTLTVNNGSSSHAYTMSLTVGSVAPPPPPNPCGTLSSTNVQPVWSGASCPSGGATCGTNDVLTFDVQGYLYNFNCASHSFSWNFGDGGTAFTQRTTHTFTTSASHPITLTVSNQYGGSVTKTFYVETTGSTSGGSCQIMTTSNIAISYLAPSGCSSANTAVACKNNEVVSFDVVSYAGYDFSCSNHTYSWNFGDGGTANTKSPQHTFTGTGPHTVSVTISNSTQPQGFTRQLTMSTDAGGTQSGCGTIGPLALSINYSNGSGTCTPLGGDCAAGEAVNFTITAYQYDLACGTHTFDWDFGDNSPHATIKDPVHQYAAQGTYTARCVVNNGTASKTLSQSVSVKGGSPDRTPVAVSFAVAPLPTVPNGYLFTPVFTPPDGVTQWSWNFGDGQNSGMISGNGSSPTSSAHVYADDKKYTVTLTAYSAQGQALGTYNHTNEADSKHRIVRH